jgi:CubicO group peptidase (beta-lactamase class C family)
LENKLPMQRDTICRIYSMTKIITSVAVLILVDEGRVRLDDPVADYLPELKAMQVLKGGTADAPELAPLKTPITIKHLLTHTSGLIYDFDGSDALHLLYQRAKLWEGSSLNDFVAKVATLPLKCQPGEEWNYGINADVLGALVETVSGMSFEAFLQKRLFTPLAMKDTAFDLPAEKLDRLAKTYQHGTDGKLTQAKPMLGTWHEAGKGLAAGGSGLFSTADDYARFAQMLCNGGQLEGKRILSRKMAELMTANHLAAMTPPHHAFSPANGWGLGVEVQLDLDHSSLPGTPGAFGWYGAATTYCRIDPKERLVAILLTQHFPFNEHKIFETFSALYYGAME